MLYSDGRNTTSLMCAKIQPVMVASGTLIVMDCEMGAYNGSRALLWAVLLGKLNSQKLNWKKKLTTEMVSDCPYQKTGPASKFPLNLHDRRPKF